MPTWWASNAVLSFVAEVNAASPGRSKVADGIIGDPAHAARDSDHNPRPDGEVCAGDITTKTAATPTGVDGQPLADLLRARALAGDKRIKYVIWNRQIFNPSVSPAWRPYTGADPHTGHIHLSVNPHSPAAPAWGVQTATQEDDVSPEQAAQLSRADTNAWETRKYLGVMEANILAHIEAQTALLAAQKGADPAVIADAVKTAVTDRLAGLKITVQDNP